MTKTEKTPDSVDATPMPDDKPDLRVVPPKWHDAEIWGDLDNPDAQAVLKSEITLMSAPRSLTPGNRWQLQTMSHADLIEHLLSRHPVSANKDGMTVVYSAGSKAGSATHDYVKTTWAHRRKDKIISMSAVAIDVDGTDHFETVAETARGLGLFFVAYTTHSHVAKSGPDGDRFRIILFLSEPFPIPRGGVRDPDRVAAIEKWQSVYIGVCESLGLSDIDASGLRLQQIMHPPRRPSDDSAYKHVICAGTALDVSTVTPGDPSKYKKSGPRASGTRLSGMADGEPAFLKDGFDVREWYYDGGAEMLVESFLDVIAWEDRGAAGDGRTILCPNDAAHSNPGEDDAGCWGCESFGEDQGFLIKCQHDHCADLRSWDMLKLIETAIDDGHAVLPDGCASLSALLCDDSFFPDEIDGEPVSFHPGDYGVEEVIEIERLGTPKKVERAFKAVVENDRAGDDHWAALYAGVGRAGNKIKAVARLDELAKEMFGANEAKRFKKLGGERLKANQAAHAATQHATRLADNQEVIEHGTPADTSMDIADPLGETLQEALATLAHRYVLADMNGKFRAIRKPDLAALRDTGQSLRSVITAQTLDDFKLFHEDRKVVVGSGEGAKLVNPAKEFIETAKRKSGVVFAPFPASAGPNEFNMYYGRTLQPNDAGCPTITSFIFNIVCSGRRDLWRWLMLWLAHMVQKPGQKPGTALVVHGAGGCGKSTMGLILDKLSAPHCRTLDKSEHVTGRFAGEHLATSICAVCAEAAFAGDRKVVNELKSLITQPTIQAEPKGLSVMEMPSYLRLFFDSNSNFVVAIDRDGSERRYCVMQVSEKRRGDSDYWEKLYGAIEGDEMGGFLNLLEGLDPDCLGLKWEDVREAPSTEERDAMGYQTLRPAVRALLNIFEDGVVSLMVGDEPATFELEDDEPARLSLPGLRAYLASKGNGHNADDADPIKLMHGLFGEEIDGMQTVKTGQGKIGGFSENTRWIEFPPRSVVVGEIERRFQRVVDVPDAGAVDVAGDDDLDAVIE